MEESANFRRLRWMDAPVWLLLAAGVLGVWVAYDRGAAWKALAPFAGGVCIYVFTSRAGEQQRVFAARAVALAAGVFSLVFVTQAGHSESFDKIVVFKPLLEWLGRWMPDLGWRDPFPNTAATFLEGLLFLAMGLALVARSSKWGRLLWIAVVLTSAALVISQSRGAWLGLAAAGVGWLALRYRPARLAAAAAGLGTLVLAAAVVLGGLGQVERVPVLGALLARPDRLEVYRGAWQLIRDLPFTGVGFGPQFAMNYSRFVLLIQVPYLTYSHNFYLETWLQFGLLGLVSMAWLLAVILAAGKRLTSRPNSLDEGAWAGLVAMLAHGLSDARMYVAGWCWAPFFFLLGLLAADEAFAVVTLPSGSSSVRRGVAGLALIAAAALLPVTSTAWWANQGGLKQARAALAPGLSEPQRSELRTAAEADFRRSLAIDPAARPANLRLGLLLSEEGRYEDAAAALEIARRAEPGNPTVQKALGLAYIWLGRTEEAAGLLRGFDDITEELNAWGCFRAESGDVDRARWAYQVSLLIDPHQEDVCAALDALE